MTRRYLGMAAVAGALLLAPDATAATAYTIEPLGGTDTTPTLFDGAVCATYECVKVPTEATVDFAHSTGDLSEDGPIARGALTLDGMLRGDTEDKLVFGYSQGAQIAGFWLRNYAPDTTVSPDTTSFLLVGDPENTYGVPWAPRVPKNPGFEVTEVWAQYDGWADWPTRFDLLAVANAVYGMLFVHPTAYDHLDLAAAEARGDVVQWDDEGITYKMVADRDLPILDPLRNLGLGRLADTINDDLREHIEAQYDRPSTQAEADAVYNTGDTGTTQDPPTEAAPTDSGTPARQRVVAVSRSAVNVDVDVESDSPVSSARADGGQGRGIGVTTVRRGLTADTEATDGDDGPRALSATSDASSGAARGRPDTGAAGGAGARSDNA